MRLNQLEFWSPAAENSWEMPISESSFEVFVDPDSLRLARVAEAIEALTEQDDSHAIVLDGQECRVLTATCVADGQQFSWTSGSAKNMPWVQRLASGRSVAEMPSPSSSFPLRTWDLGRPDETYQRLMQRLREQIGEAERDWEPSLQTKDGDSVTPLDKWREQTEAISNHISQLTRELETAKKCHLESDLKQSGQAELLARRLADAQEQSRMLEVQRVSKQHELDDAKMRERQALHQVWSSGLEHRRIQSPSKVPAAAQHLWKQLESIDQRILSWRDLKTKLGAAIQRARADLESMNLGFDEETDGHLSSIRLGLSELRATTERVTHSPCQLETSIQQAHEPELTIESATKRCNEISRRLHAVYERLSEKSVSLSRKSVLQNLRHLRRLDRDLSRKIQRWLELRIQHLSDLSRAGVNADCLLQRSQQGFCRCAEQDIEFIVGPTEVATNQDRNTISRDYSFDDLALANLTRLSAECQRLQAEQQDLRKKLRQCAERCNGLEQELVDSKDDPNPAVLAPVEFSSQQLEEYRRQYEALLRKISGVWRESFKRSPVPLETWTSWLGRLSDGQWNAVAIDASTMTLCVENCEHHWYAWPELDAAEKVLVLMACALGSGTSQELHLPSWPVVILGPESCEISETAWVKTVSLLAATPHRKIWLMTADESWARESLQGVPLVSLPNWKPYENQWLLGIENHEPDTRRVIVQRANNSDAEEFPGELRDQVYGEVETGGHGADWTRTVSVEAYETAEQIELDLEREPHPDQWEKHWVDSDPPALGIANGTDEVSASELHDERQMTSELKKFLSGLGIRTWDDYAGVTCHREGVRVTLGRDVCEARLADELWHWHAVAVLLNSGEVQEVFDARVLVACEIRDPSQIQSADLHQLASRVWKLGMTAIGRRILDAGSDIQLVRLSGWLKEMENLKPLRGEGDEATHVNDETIANAQRESQLEPDVPRTIRIDSAHSLKPQPRRQRERRPERTTAASVHYLELSDDVKAAPSVGPKTAAFLEELGIRTVRDFLEADPRSIAKRLDRPQINPSVLLEWQQQAELVCRVPNLREHNAQLLVACGIPTAEALASWEPESLLALVSPYAESHPGKSMLPSRRAPNVKEVTDWIRWAQDKRSLTAA